MFKREQIVWVDGQTMARVLEDRGDFKVLVVVGTTPAMVARSRLAAQDAFLARNEQPGPANKQYFAKGTR